MFDVHTVFFAVRKTNHESYIEIIDVYPNIWVLRMIYYFKFKSIFKLHIYYMPFDVQINFILFVWYTKEGWKLAFYIHFEVDFHLYMAFKYTLNETM